MGSSRGDHGGANGPRLRGRDTPAWAIPERWQSLIEFDRVERSYPSGDRNILALTEVTTQLRRGEFVTLWGPSGSGKTTLCNLAGLLDDPTSGTVRFDGLEVATLSDDRRTEIRGQRLGFVFQSFNLIPVLSAVENVMLPLQARGESTREAKRRAMSLLDELDVAAQATRRPDLLSGGQRQRVAIARALVGGPELVIADEPTANLDSDTAQHIVRVMREARDRHGTAFLVSTHDQRLLDLRDRRLQLEDGRIVEDLPPLEAHARATPLERSGS